MHRGTTLQLNRLLLWNRMLVFSSLCYQLLLTERSIELLSLMPFSRSTNGIERQDCDCCLDNVPRERQPWFVVRCFKAKGGVRIVANFEIWLTWPRLRIRLRPSSALNHPLATESLSKLLFSIRIKKYPLLSKVQNVLSKQSFETLKKMANKITRNLSVLPDLPANIVTSD